MPERHASADAQRALGAHAYGLLDLRPQGLVRVLLQELQVVLRVQLEHLRRSFHAQRVGLAQLVVDDHLQCLSLAHGASYEIWINASAVDRFILTLTSKNVLSKSRVVKVGAADAAARDRT